jgi:hypothetical protein
MFSYRDLNFNGRKEHENISLKILIDTLKICSLERNFTSFRTRQFFFFIAELSPTQAYGKMFFGFVT